MSISSTKSPATSAHARTTTSRRAASRSKHPSDDEILGIVTSVARPAPAASDDFVGADRTRRPALAASPNDASVGPRFGSNGNAGQGDSVGTHLQMRARGSEDPRLQAPESHSAFVISPDLAQILDAHPELRAALDTAQQFRAVFPTPAVAQDAKTQLDELDAMFFSASPADHAALAARIHELSPAAFHGLAHAIQAHAAQIAAHHADADANASARDSSSAGGPSFAPSAKGGIFGRNDVPAVDATVALATDGLANGNPAVVGAGLASPAPAKNQAVISNPAAPSADAGEGPAFPNVTSVAPGHVSAGSGFSPDREQVAKGGNLAASPQSSAQNSAAPDPRRLAQLAFYHSANAAAVRQIVSAIESHVNRLLPESVSSGAKTRIVGEIYRDLGATLGANRQLSKQLRNTFTSAAGDAVNPATHQQSAQNAIVALLVGRAKQALPSIAKRVINEWTHGVVAANRERIAHHESAARRVDISGASPSDGVNRKPISPRDVDYARLSDSDILNL